MRNLIGHLSSFNRKERFILLQEACGPKTFQLSKEFRDKLKCCLKLHFEIPSDAYVAMDYHIGWIQMAIHLARRGNDELVRERDVPGVNDNQQDVDLLIAFTKDSISHLILVEAKADTPWDYEQLSRKVKRLRGVYQEDADNDLKMYFVLISPREIGKSKHICVEEWPCWMRGSEKRPYHIELKLCSSLRKITRCNRDRSPSKDGEYYKVEPIEKS